MYFCLVWPKLYEICALDWIQTIDTIKSLENPRSYYWDTCLGQCFNKKAFSFIKVSHVHAANGLSIQDQTCNLRLLREILEDEICLLYLWTTLISKNVILQKCTMMSSLQDELKRKRKYLITTARFNHAFASWVSVWSSSTCCMTLSCLSA